ncbi:MAG TPA: HdeA/HdeB family chaperone [Rubrivivax sp.]|jgi:acid stress chaperone HdeA|nr:HNS-dependent expression A [Pseudomonadota bacterium]HPP81930.1 HdeA/HdeB family chaperone [Rubrivivax sp.]
MKTLTHASIVALALAAGMPLAQAATPAAASGKSIVKTTCQDYLALDETIKPKFIYYAVGHGKKGDREAVLDVIGTDKVQPELDEYCKVNLTKSAYEHVMKTSMASEKTNK